MSKRDGMRVYAASLSDYNDGKLVGKWFDLEDYDSGKEVMEAVQEYLEELNEKDGGHREEWAFHDAEGIPAGMYSEWMGAETFDTLIGTVKASEELDIPADVIGEYLSEYTSGKMDADEIVSELQDNYAGSGDSFQDFVENYCDDVGLPEEVAAYCIEMDETTARCVVADEEDSIRERLEDDYDMDDKDSVKEFEEAVEEELDELRRQLDKDPVQWYLDMTGMDMEDLTKEVVKGNSSLFSIDWKEVARQFEIGGDFNYFKSKEDKMTYVFYTH